MAAAKTAKAAKSNRIDVIKFKIGPGSFNWDQVRWAPPGAPYVCAITEPGNAAFAQAGLTDESWAGGPKLAITPDRRPGHRGGTVMKVTRLSPTGERERRFRPVTSEELAAYIVFDGTDPGEARDKLVKSMEIVVDWNALEPDPTHHLASASPRKHTTKKTAAISSEEKARRSYRHDRARRVEACRALVQQLGAAGLADLQASAGGAA